MACALFVRLLLLGLLILRFTHVVTLIGHFSLFLSSIPLHLIEATVFPFMWCGEYLGVSSLGYYQ